MTVNERFFSSLSKSELKDLYSVKSEISSKYLIGGIRAEGASRSLRATPFTAATQNVVGVGIDEKFSDGASTGIAAVKFLVRSKLPLSALSKSEQLPSMVNGYPTDIEEVGLIVPIPAAAKATRTKKALAAGSARKLDTSIPNPRVKIRPAQPGSSVGFEDPASQFVMAGTFGALVRDANGDRYVLSNNHVLAAESGVEADGTLHNPLPVGAPIYQPGLLDGGSTATDQIAALSRWIDLRADQNGNRVDAAIAKAVSNGLVSPDILFIGKHSGPADATKDMLVHKFGRTTSYRVGQVSSVLFDITIQYDVGNVVFTDQIAIRTIDGQRFSDAGDSGSLILEKQTNKAVGLLFAGATNGSMTFANQIGEVLKQLKVTLV